MGFIGTSEGPSGRLASQLGEALGMGLGELTGSYFANSAINKIVSDPNLKNASAEERQQALIQRLSPYGARGERMLAKQLELEQKAEDKQLAKLHNKFLRGEQLTSQEQERLSPEMILKKREFEKSKRLGESFKKTLIDRGVPEDLANYYGDAISMTEKGTGQSAVIGDALQMAQRFGSVPTQSAFTENAGSGKFSSLNPEFEFPLPETEPGLNPKERAEMQSKFAQENIKESNANRQRKRSLDEDHFSFKKLENLNPKISKGFSKWNINPLTGEPVIPAQATPEEREFAKILVQQLRNAKDTFGARITNFDAQKYLEGFPNLADSPQAREAIIKDLLKVNEINRLYAESLDEVYRTYKPGQISSSQASQIAEDIVKPKVDKLWEEYSQGSSLKPNNLQEDEILLNYNGKKYAVPKDEVEVWMNAGATK